MDRENFDAIIARYLEKFALTNAKPHEEYFKWQAIDCFQTNWNIDAEDLYDSFTRAVAKTDVLLDGGHSAPSSGIKSLLKSLGYDEAAFLKALSEVRGAARVTSDTPEETYDALKKYGQDLVELARKLGYKGCILPEESALEAVDYDDTLLFGVRTLDDVLRILSGNDDVSDLLIWNTEAYHNALAEQPLKEKSYMDFAEILGQEGAKRGVEIACAGGHNVLLVGAPGSGKSSIAKALAGILPPMTREESAITSKVYSVAGRSGGGVGLMRTRPFRAPHISASKAAMLGGGSGDNILPGEVSLATNGVLFADEFCEAPKSTLEALRAPMEDRKVTISRLKAKIEYPASFMLVAASNPCPCGYYGEGDRCTCTPGQRLNYLAKLSGPIMDRIDIQLWVHPVETTVLVRGGKAEPSAEIAKRVLRAREIQRERLGGSGIFTNAEMSSKQLETFCPLDEDCKVLLERLIDKLGLSARAYTRIIKIARTIADLAGSARILPAHLSEAASYRFLDRRNILEL